MTTAKKKQVHSSIDRLKQKLYTHYVNEISNVHVALFSEWLPIFKEMGSLLT